MQGFGNAFGTRRIFSYHVTMEKILVIEDEKTIQNLVKAYLENEGYRVLTADTGTAGLDVFQRENPDLIVLDLNLPYMDGLELAYRLRQTSDVYILMLTARAEEDDRITGLKSGADDYLTKPFSPREMVARVEALLRRKRQQVVQINEITYRHTEINLLRHEAKAGGKLLDLTPTEFKLLWTLMEKREEVLGREYLLKRVWGGDYYGNDRVVDVYVGQVRRKIEEACGCTLIETVRGVGYKFVDEVN